MAALTQVDAGRERQECLTVEVSWISDTHRISSTSYTESKKKGLLWCTSDHGARVI